MLFITLCTACTTESLDEPITYEEELDTPIDDDENPDNTDDDEEESGNATDDGEEPDNTTQNNCSFVDFQYINDAPHHLGEMSNDYLLIGIDSKYNDSQIQTFITGLNQFDQEYDYTIHHPGRTEYKFKNVPLKFKSAKNCNQITQIIAELEQNQIVSYVHYTLQSNVCTTLFGEPVGDLCVSSYGSDFYVEVFDENDLTDLYETISQTKTELVKQNEFSPTFYKVRATKTSNGDGLEMANYFHETGLFKSSDPGIGLYPVE